MSPVARLLKLWFRIPPGAWISCCECYVLWGRGLCDELFTRPEEVYRLWWVVVRDQETTWMRRPWHNGVCCAPPPQKKKIGWIRGIMHLMETIPMCYELIKCKRIRQTHLVYLLFIIELVTCFDPAGSSSGLYVNQVILKKLHTSLGSHWCLQYIYIYIFFFFLNINGIPKMCSVF